MRNASPSAIVSPNSLITAPQQAGNAPICSGSTTCCATTSPRAFMSAQEASCDSRTMVEKPVRNSEFCISCTMPERLALTTSRATASTCMGEGSRIGSGLLRHDQVLPFIDARGLAGVDDGGAVELVENGGPPQRQGPVEPPPLVERGFALAAVQPPQP